MGRRVKTAHRGGVAWPRAITDCSRVSPVSTPSSGVGNAATGRCGDYRSIEVAVSPERLTIYRRAPERVPQQPLLELPGPVPVQAGQSHQPIGRHDRAAMFPRYEPTPETALRSTHGSCYRHLRRHHPGWAGPRAECRWRRSAHGCQRRVDPGAERSTEAQAPGPPIGRRDRSRGRGSVDSHTLDQVLAPRVVRPHATAPLDPLWRALMRIPCGTGNADRSRREELSPQAGPPLRPAVSVLVVGHHWIKSVGTWRSSWE